MDKKVCSHCKQLKETSNFTKNRTAQDGLDPRCIKCRKELRKKYRATINLYDKKYKKAHPDEIKSKKLKQKYGINIEKRDEIIKVNQQGKCPICEKVLNREKSNEIHVDHNHKTGKLRGILCNTCNLLIGFSKENIDTLKNAIKYLKYWNS